MREIWKYPVPIAVGFDMDMPEGAEVLTVQVQGASPEMWALVHPDMPKVTRRFRLYGTGQPIEGRSGRYIGTFQMAGGAFIWHLFEEVEP